MRATVQPAVERGGMDASGAPRPALSLLDSASLIVGIIIGAGIYQMAPEVARGVGGAAGVLGIWVLGGVVSLCGALSYAELATAYPRVGGDYVYLTRAYGRWAGFLFGWMQTVIVRPGDIAVMAFAFGTYGAALWDPLGGGGGGVGVSTSTLYAGLAVVGVTAIQVVGVREARWTQNLLTGVKAVGLLAVVGVGFLVPGRVEGTGGAVEPIPVALAFIFVLFSYGGWNEMAYVAAEVRNPERNIVRAMWLGMVAVMALYVLVNAAFLHALGYAGVATAQAVASETVRQVFPVAGDRVVAALICVSALGAVNGLVFAGARISYALGAEHRVFGWLGRWDGRAGMPVRSLVLQGVMALGLIVVLGSFVNTLLYTAAPVYTFYLATCLAVGVLRRREPGTPRPFRVPWYPVPTLVFGGTCGWLIYSAVAYRPMIALIALGILLAGLPVYVWGRRGTGQPERGREQA